MILIQIIIRLHIILCRYRRQIASGSLAATSSLPASSNMRQVSWDTELAALAQMWALQCREVTLEDESLRRAFIGASSVEVSQVFCPE